MALYWSLNIWRESVYFYNPIKRVRFSVSLSSDPGVVAHTLENSSLTFLKTGITPCHFHVFSVPVKISSRPRITR